MFYVHFFILTFPDADRLHDIAIAAERFRGPSSEQPDVWLVKSLKPVREGAHEGVCGGVGLPVPGLTSPCDAES